MKTVQDLVKTKDTSSILAFSLIIFVFLYFIVVAFRFTPQDISELDSLGQHIPLAESILHGKLFNPPELHNGLGYYLPIGEIILSIYISLGVPLGLYNVLALFILGYLCYRLALRVGLPNSLAIVFSFSIAYLNSIIRLVPTQKNDIWLNVFFCWVLYLLLKTKKNTKYIILLGVAIGLLVGVKYSGILFALILLILFYRDLKKSVNTKNILVFIFPVFVFGIVWYFRNYLITKNPFYPISIFGFIGHPTFIVPQGYENLLDINSLKITLEALVSEYLLWSFLPLLFVIKLVREGRNIFKNEWRLIMAALLSTFVYLLSPTDFTRVNITSNMRFLHITFILLILAAFVVAKRIKREKEIVLLSILNSVSVFPQLSYYPKLVILWLILIFFFFFRSNSLDKRNI